MFRKMLLFLYKHLAVLCWLVQPHRCGVCCFYLNFPWRRKLKWKPHRLPTVAAAVAVEFCSWKAPLSLWWILFLQGQKNRQVWNAWEVAGATAGTDLWDWECSIANTPIVGSGKELTQLGDKLEWLKGEFGVSLGSPNASSSSWDMFSCI